MKTILLNDKILNLFKVGDKITIIKNPGSWSSGAGGGCPLRNGTKYPYTSEIVKIVYVDDASDHIAILDSNNFGWSLTSLIKDNCINSQNFERYKKLKKLNERRR